MKFKPDHLFQKNDGTKLFVYITNDFINSITSYGIESFKIDLWRFSKAAINSSKGDSPIQDFTKLRETITKLMEGAWQYSTLARQYEFKHPASNIHYIKNVYRQLPEHRPPYEEEKHSETPFHGILHHLTKEETRDFTIVIDNFFVQTNLSDWKEKMIKWSEYANRSESIISYDNFALDTYEDILKLAEAAFVAHNMTKIQELNSFDYNPLEDKDLVYDVDSIKYDFINPLSEINWVFSNYTLDNLKSEFKKWSDFASRKNVIWNKGEPRKLLEFENDLIYLLEAGWTLIKLDEIPTKWLNPNEYPYFHQMKKDENSKSSDTNNLLKETYTDLPYALSLAYENFQLNTLKDYLKDLLEFALGIQIENFRINEQYHNCINKIIEVLYLINLENAQKRKE